VRETIRQHLLLKKGDTVLCAVSGGADSICLLHVMQALKEEFDLTVCVANVNHLLRGEESNRDSNFVKSVCKAANVELFYREYDIRKISREKKIGEEECGRICRYEFFQEIASKSEKIKIATAHNLNDNAETILFRLIRGTASHGLSGIKYKRENIIRPLLDVSRNDIEKYLLANGITWCEDSTNKLTIYTRNKIRSLVLPMLNEISNNAHEKIVSASKLIAEDDEFLESLADEKTKEVFFDSYILIDKVLESPLPIQRRIISKVLTRWGSSEISYKKIDRFLNFLSFESGKKFDINFESFAEKSYNKVYLKKRFQTDEFNFVFDEDGTVDAEKWSVSISTEMKFEKQSGNNTVIFDADKLKYPINLRYRHPGDRIKIKGLGGSKKISDILCDEKIEKQFRDSIPILEKDNEILYLCGLRQSCLYEITKDTKRFLIIKYSNTKER